MQSRSQTGCTLFLLEASGNVTPLAEKVRPKKKEFAPVGLDTWQCHVVATFAHAHNNFKWRPTSRQVLVCCTLECLVFRLMRTDKVTRFCAIVDLRAEKCSPFELNLKDSLR